MRHNNNTNRPSDPYPLHEAILDILETYFGTWWTSEAIAARLNANPYSVRKAIQRSRFPATIICRVEPADGVLEYQATCRSYLHDELAA